MTTTNQERVWVVLQIVYRNGNTYTTEFREPDDLVATMKVMTDDPNVAYWRLGSRLPGGQPTFVVRMSHGDSPTAPEVNEVAS